MVIWYSDFMTKAQKKKFIKKTFSDTEVVIVLENMYDEIRVIGEQHGSLNKKIDSLDVKIDSLDRSLNGKLDDFIVETKNNFKPITEHLSRIEDDVMDLRKKMEKADKKIVNAKDLEWLKRKVMDIEKQLENYKKQQSALAAKL